MTDHERQMDYGPRRRSFLPSRRYTKPKLVNLDENHALNWSGVDTHSHSDQFIDVKRPVIQPKKIKPATERQAKSKVLKRQGLKKLPPFKPIKTKKHPIKVLSLAAIALFVGLGIFSLFDQKGAKNSNDAPSVKAVQDKKEVNSSYYEPTFEQFKSYKVDSDELRYFSARTVDINARVFPIDQNNGKFVGPQNVYDVGWYRASAKPGNESTTLMVGTIAANNNLGVFRRIGSLKPGDVFLVTMGDGKTHEYRIVTTKYYPNDRINAQELLTPIQPGKESLNVLALTDRYDIRMQQYEASYAVFATKLN